MEQLELLKKLISTPSVTRSEHEVSAIMKADMECHGYEPECIGLNLLCYPHHYDASKPTLLLNSHMDTDGKQWCHHVNGPDRARCRK